jgi:outer membrane protein assembly factor BamB
MIFRMTRINTASLIYIGIKGSVVALDRRTGAEVWRTQLKGEFVNVALDGDTIFATARGEIFCLDAITGRIRWNNQLKGMGWGLCTIAGTNIAPMAQLIAQQQQAAQHSAHAGSK